MLYEVITFPAKEGLPDNLTAGTGTIGVRLSSMKPLVELLQLVGPLTGTSANQAGRPPAQTARMVEEELGCDIDLIIDAGPTTGGRITSYNVCYTKLLRFLGFSIELNRPEHVAMVRHRHSRLPERFDLLHERIDLIRTV